MWPLQRLVSSYQSSTRDGAQNTTVYMATHSSILVKAKLQMKSQETVARIAFKICQIKATWICKCDEQKTMDKMFNSILHKCEIYK
jgi:thiamine biosynthesis protein ThiC